MSRIAMDLVVHAAWHPSIPIALDHDIANQLRLDAEEVELAVRLKSPQTELEARRNEKSLLARATQSREGEVTQGNTQLRELRGADQAPDVCAN